MVVGVQQLVSQMTVGFAQEGVVELLDLGVVVALAQGVALVLAVEGAGTLGDVGVENVGAPLGRKQGRT